MGADTTFKKELPSPPVKPSVYFYAVVASLPGFLFGYAMGGKVGELINPGHRSNER